MLEYAAIHPDISRAAALQAQAAAIAQAREAVSQQCSALSEKPPPPMGHMDTVLREIASVKSDMEVAVQNLSSTHTRLFGPIGDSKTAESLMPVSDNQAYMVVQAIKELRTYAKILISLSAELGSRL